ncbi:unnamed protein product [Effrenium voratum]|uniref:RNB domain-containing protein n=1 Tax=Effrenium voratum TaxID=2562239 RepID=A0AA36NIM6_9DINO|nr:unnamed protein product [Effrenium voratum]
MSVERLTFSVLWEMTPEAEVVDTKYCKAIIKSREALSYAEAQARIDDPQDQSEITTSLRNLLRLTRIIRAKRVAAGALELASQEVRFELDSETQDPTDVAEYQQKETNKLIEDGAGQKTKIPGSAGLWENPQCDTWISVEGPEGKP